MPEEEEQKTENLFEKIMKEKFPNLVKEIDIQVQEAQRALNKLDPKRAIQRHIIMKMPKVKDKERISFYCCSTIVVPIFPLPLYLT